MKIRTRLVVVLALWLFALPGLALDPLSFEELSLLLRVGESSASIIEEVGRRQILQPLTAQELKVLKSSGASDALLTEVQRPERMVPAEIAAAVERRRTKQVAAAIEDASPVPMRVQPDLSTASPLVSAGDKDLIIEKIVILKDPINQPFHLYFKVSANAGRTEAIYYIPGKLYEREGVDEKLELPVNLVLRGVQENDWARLTLHLDPAPNLITTVNALKRHTARIPITDQPLYAEPFEFYPSRATFIVSLNTNQQFVYQVYWRVED